MPTRRSSGEQTGPNALSIGVILTFDYRPAGLRYHDYLTALILSGGGMFAAWQAGAWQELSKKMPKPEWVIGASAGSLNAWAIAGGLPPEDLIDRWLHLESYSRFHWRFPTGPKSSVLDPTPVWDDVDDIPSDKLNRILWGDAKGFSVPYPGVTSLK